MSLYYNIIYMVLYTLQYILNTIENVPSICFKDVYIICNIGGRGDPSSENLIKFYSKSLFSAIPLSAVVVFNRKMECIILYRYSATIFSGDFQKYFIFNNRENARERLQCQALFTYTFSTADFNSHNNPTFL